MEGATNNFLYNYEEGVLYRKRNMRPCISKASGCAYVKVYAEGVYYQYHNVVWVCCNGKIPEGFTVDHIDGDKLNNNISNLRLASSHEQTYNTRGHGKTSQYKGVSFNKAAGKYFSRIMIRGKEIWLGSFDSEHLAHISYKLASEKYHGDFIKR